MVETQLINPNVQFIHSGPLQSIYFDAMPSSTYIASSIKSDSDPRWGWLGLGPKLYDAKRSRVNRYDLNPRPGSQMIGRHHSAAGTNAQRSFTKMSSIASAKFQLP